MSIAQPNDANVRYQFGDITPATGVSVRENDYLLTEALRIMECLMEPQSVQTIAAISLRAASLMEYAWFGRAAYYIDTDGDR